MQAAIWTTTIRQAAFAAALVVCGAGLASADDAPAEGARVKGEPQPTTAPAPEMIARWIEELDADQYSVRQQATRNLASAGEGAIEPLKNAAINGNLEVSTRAISVLVEYYLKTGALSSAADRAEEALEQILASNNPLAAQRAEQVVTSNDEVRQKRAIEKIRELGGVVKMADEPREFGNRIRVEPSQPDIEWVAIPPEWKGGDEGLKYVGRLKNLHRLYRIVGNQVSDAGINKLKKVLPDLQIEPRGAMLGVECNPMEERCLVTRVMPGSAADKGGIRPGDWIQSFGDKPVTNFNSLIDLIKGTRPGQEVTVVVMRSSKSVTLKIVMGGWNQGKP